MRHCKISLLMITSWISHGHVGACPTHGPSYLYNPLAYFCYKIKDASVPHKPNYDSVLKVQKYFWFFGNIILSDEGCALWFYSIHWSIVDKECKDFCFDFIVYLFWLLPIRGGCVSWIYREPILDHRIEETPYLDFIVFSFEEIFRKQFWFYRFSSA